MSFLITLSAILLFGCSPENYNTPKSSSNFVIYGEDNRVDTYDLDGSIWEERARAVIMRVKNSKMKKQSSGEFKLIGASLKKSKDMCGDEKFINQRLPGSCTGFLIGEDLIATAGHCAQDEFYCENYSWVFDYKLKGPDDKKYHYIPKKNVYTCKKIKTKVYGRNIKLDFAIIQLDRKVVGRTPLTLRRDGKIAVGTKLALIGHPNGMPLKFADGAEVIKNLDKDFFQANLDSFQVNSGSPVFDVDTGIVEGILVRGDMDYRWSYEDGCNRVHKIKWNCKERECRLEDVTRITKLP